MITTMPRPSRPKTVQPAAAGKVRWQLVVLFAAGLIGALCATDCLAQDQPDTADVSPPVGLPLVNWTESEQAALKVAVGRRRARGGSALYMLLAKAATFAPLTDEQWASLDQVAYANLVSQPQRYTGQPIRLQLRVQLLQKLTAGSDEMGAALNWRQGTPAWRIDAFEAQAMVRGETLPVRLFCVQDPMEVLGKPLFEDGEESVYGAEGKGLSRSKPGTLVEVAGLFFKTWETELRESDTIRTEVAEDGTITMSPDLGQVPFLIVWDMRRIRGERVGQGNSNGMPRAIFIVTLLVMLLVMFYLLKKAVRQRRRGDGLATKIGRGEYRPLRDIEADDDPDVERDEEEEAVDPDLAAAADAYRREREQENPDA
jgi:hypothetical protein